MSKAEILKELPKLLPDDRRQIFETLCDLQERDLINGQGPSPEEKALLDRELEEYSKNPEAGSTWDEVERRLLKRPNQGNIRLSSVPTQRRIYRPLSNGM